MITERFDNMNAYVSKHAILNFVAFVFTVLFFVLFIYAAFNQPRDCSEARRFAEIHDSIRGTFDSEGAPFSELPAAEELEQYVIDQFMECTS